MNTFDAILAKLDAEIATETAREKEARSLTFADGTPDPVGQRVGDMHAARIYGMWTAKITIRRQQAAEAIAKLNAA